MAVYKNKSNQKIPIYASDADGNPATGIASTITGRISLDGGTPQTLTNSQPSELSSSLAPGVYIFTLTSDETNCDMFVVSASSSQSGVDIKPVAAFTEPEIRQADIQAIASHAQSAANLKAACDGTTGFNLGNGQIVAASVTGNVGGSVNSVTSAVTVGAMNANTITATAIQDGAITANKIASAAITSSKFAADAIDSSALASSAATEVAAAVWDRQTSDLNVTGSVGKRVVDNLDTTVSSRSTFNPGSQTVTVGAMNANTITSTAIQDGAITANKIASGAITSAKFAADAIDSSALAASAATEVAAAVWDRQTSDLTVNGSVGKRVADNVDATISSRSTFNPSSQTVTVGAMNANTITATAIQDGAITANKIASAAITSAKFATDAITDTILASSAATEVAAAVWDRQTSALNVTGSVGKRVVDNLDTTVSSRSTFNPGSQTVTVGAMNSNTITSTVIQDNAITSSKIASDAKQSIASFVWNALTTVVTEAQSLGKWILDRLNDTITSRLAASSYTEPDNAGISAIKAKTDNLPSNPASQTKLDDIHSMMEFQPGTPGYWRYRSSALETTPSGSGGATPEEIWSYTGGSGRTLTGAVTVGAMNSNVITASAIQDGAITANKIASDAIQASKIQDGAITANKLASGAITAAKFATDAITDTVLASSAATEISAAVWDRLTANITTPNSIGKRVVDNLDTTVSSRSTFNPSSQTVTVGAMNANTITSTVIQDGAITAAKIATDAIQASKIQDGAITANKIASGAITSTKIATDAITADKISSDAISEIQSGLATDGHLTTVETMVGSVQSDLDTLSGKFDEIDEDVYEKVGTPAYRRLRKRALEEAPKGYKTW